MRSNLPKIFALAVTLFILHTFSPINSAQTSGSAAVTTTSSATQNVARITQAVRESDRVTLKGNTHPLASKQNDQGPAPDSLPMERMLLVLKRSAEQETSLKSLMEGQQSKSSPNFHQWLTPDQFGQQFGVSDSDVQAVTAWLQTHGFTVNRVAAGKMLIEFSGTAGQVREAFQTEIHKFMVKGEAHWANASDPTIPSALSPVVRGVNTLHNFAKKPMVHNRGVFTRAGDSAEIKPLLTSSGCTTLTGNPAPCFGVGPADFAAIYNVPSTVGGVAAGTGQTIAIIGNSEICTGLPLPQGCTTDDVQNFRKIFSLPSTTPQIILDGPDPGLNGDEIEGDLDVEYSGAIAPHAQILFVIAENTETSAGIDLAAERVVDYNLAPVMSESFGACEFFLGASNNAFYLNLWQQAAAQGITVVISAGDNGSAACDSSDAFPNVSVNGLNVNGIASTPYNVAAGGTDFDFTAAGYPNAFWNTSSSPTNGLSAKGYIPETTWNDSCAQSGIAGCNGASFTAVSPLLQVVGGSGGQSNCVDSGCVDGYAKPSWQSGTGVPGDGLRDLPDVSLFSSSGLLSNSFYILCAADIGGTCTPGAGPGIPAAGFSFLSVGGTSAAAPAFAGIMALVNQNMVNAGHAGRQGNANFVLYPMAAAETLASCNSSSSPAANCVFNDVVKGNNSVPCAVGTVFNCVSPSAGSIGVLQNFTCNANFTSCSPDGLPGFLTGTGYDLATGLGSLNVNNLVNGWPAAVGAFTPTSTTLTLSPLSACPAGTPAGITSCVNIVHGATVTINVTVTGSAPPLTATINIPEDVTLIGTCQTATPNCFVGGANTAGVDRFNPVTGNVDFGQLVGGVSSGSTMELVGGTYNVTAHYAGDGVHGVSDSSTPIQVKVSPEGSRTTVSIFAPLSVPYGSFVDVRTDIVGTASGFETATGQVTMSDSFAGASPVTLNLTANGFAEYQSPKLIFPGNNTSGAIIPALAVGSHSFTSVYGGDASYTGSTSAATAITITQGPTSSIITGAPTTVPANTNFTLSAAVGTQSIGNAPTGTVSFFAGSTLLGTAPVVAVPIIEGPQGPLDVGGSATLTTAKIAAASSITALYNGDANYAASPASAAVQVAVTAGATFTLSSASNPTVVAGNSGTSVITVAPANSFTGTVALTCSVAPSNLTSTPTCSFSLPSIVLGASQTSTLTVATTATTSASVYTVTVTGTSGTTVVTTTTTVTVTAPVTPSFTITGASGVAVVTSASPRTVVFTVTPTGGFTGTVTLTCSVGATNPVAATAPTCSMSPASIVLGAAQTSTLSVTVTSTTTQATSFPVTVTGTSGATVVPDSQLFNVAGNYTFTPAASSFSASAPGQSGNVVINITATSGFPFPVTLSNPSVAGPTQTSPPACSFSGVFQPITTVPLTQAAPSISPTLTCTTTAASTVFKPSNRPSNPRWLIPGSAAAATLVFTLFLLWVPSMRKRRGLVFAGLVLFVAGAVCAGCGGGGGGTTPPPNTGTQVGSYVVTIVATGGETQQTLTVTFVLQ